MKECTKCHEVKELSEYCKHKSMRDGHLNSCRVCQNISNAKYKKDNKERIKEHRSLPHIVAARKKSRREKGVSQASKEIELRSRAKYPTAHKARKALHRAIALGKIIRPDVCSICKINCKPDAHHRDYLKPLEVIFLCSPCHKEEHKLRTPLNRI